MNPPQQELNRLALAKAIKESQDTHLLRLELFDCIATEMKAKYDALLKAGFGAEQALELLKARAI